MCIALKDTISQHKMGILHILNVHTAHSAHTAEIVHMLTCYSQHSLTLVSRANYMQHYITFIL